MRTQSSVERSVVKRVNRPRPSAATRAPSPEPAPAVVARRPRTLLPEPPAAVVARRPRTSLIDAEWEWLALRAELRARSDRAERDEADEDGGEGFVQPHTKTLPPPPFQPYGAARPVAENSQTLKSVAPETGPESSRRARRASARRMWGVLVMTALVCFAAGVGLLHGAASFVERDHGRVPVELAARMRRPRPAAPLSKRVAAPTDAPAPVAVARDEAVLPPPQLVERREPTRASKAPPAKVKRGHVHPSASLAVAAKKRWARPSRASDNPY